MLEGTKLRVMETIADIQEAVAIEKVGDRELAEATELDINLVRSALDDLYGAGYVTLEKADTLAGLSYDASLTREGRMVLAESRKSRV